MSEGSSDGGEEPISTSTVEKQLNRDEVSAEHIIEFVKAHKGLTRQCWIAVVTAMIKGGFSGESIDTTERSYQYFRVAMVHWAILFTKSGDKKSKREVTANPHDVLGVPETAVPIPTPAEPVPEDTTATVP